jgi:RPAP1-like, N-terminal
MRTAYKQRVQERIDQEPADGTKLAARSVRIGPSGSRIDVPSSLSSSSSNIVPTVANRKAKITFDEQKESSNTNKVPVVPVIGTVVERKSKRRPRPGNNSSLSSSSIRNENNSVEFSTGFPSIRKQPLGTFVVSNSNYQTPIHPRSTIVDNKADGETLASLTNPSLNNDATAMLQQMSVEEINESIEELYSVLKPETIQFLKHRQQQKRQNVTSGYTSIANDCDTVETPALNSLDPTTKDSEMEHYETSKLQMAQIMTSIKSYDDIDAAYNEYINNDLSHTDNIMKEVLVTKNLDSKLLTSYSIYDEGIVNDNTVDDTKFHIACMLLRSTSSQQTLWASRIVLSRLKQELMTSDGRSNLLPLIYQIELYPKKSVWTFPILLPVALRCLLDAPIKHNEGSSILQTTYVLQSIYILLQLRVCSDHLISFPVVFGKPMENTTTSNKLNYHVICLNDAIPTVPIRFCYATANAEPIKTEATSPSNQTGGIDTNTVAAAYWTSTSTSTSANQDGQDFLCDPMWTLLSKMRIIPRIAYFLQLIVKNHTNPNTKSMLLPIEARQSICGILAMIGQRSPGAASAIVHHPTLVPDLLSPAFVYFDDATKLQYQYDSHTMILVLYLLCTLTRQSRNAAEGIYRLISQPMDHCPSGLLLHILTIHSTIHDNSTINSSEKKLNSAIDSDKFVMQQWGIILWRSLLRYGFGLDFVPTMVTLSSSHLTLGLIDSTKQLVSLAPEWYTCYAVILHGTHTSNKSQDDDHAINNMLTSPTWQRLSIYHLQEIGENLNSTQNEEVVRLASAIFIYWKAVLFTLAESSIEKPNTNTTEFTNTSLANVDLLLSALKSILIKNDLKQIISSVMHSIYCTDFCDVLVLNDRLFVQWEARSVTFLETLLALVAMMKQTSIANSKNQLNEIDNLEKHLAKMFIDELNQLSTMRIDINEKNTEISIFIDTARRCILNKVHASIISFLYHGEIKFDVQRARCAAFTIIGRLDFGEESTALMLFGLHDLFRPSPVSGKEMEQSSLSELLLLELSLSPKRHKQLGQSCKLISDNSISASSKGLFDIQSLLSDAGDDTNPRLDSGSDYLLPVGKYWLWKLLSGDSRNRLPAENTGVESIFVNVISTALEVIYELEVYQSVDCFATAMQLGTYAKLYYLTNLCLQGEAVLFHDRIAFLSDKLFDFYFYSCGLNGISHLAQECRVHLDPKPDTNTVTTASYHTTTIDEELVKEILNPKTSNGKGLSTLQMQSLETYVGDMCDAYLDFGLQYAFFTKSIRLFLANDFPTKIRLNLLNRFRSTLHLLSLEDDKYIIISLLSGFISGGMPSVDHSMRDDPDLIDEVASLYSTSFTDRDDDVFVKLWTICLIARSLAISLFTNNSSGIFVSKRRIRKLDSRLSTRVVRTTALWLETDGSVGSLITSSLQSEIDSIGTLTKSLSTMTNLNSTQWEEIVALLKSTIVLEQSLKD